MVMFKSHIEIPTKPAVDARFDKHFTDALIAQNPLSVNSAAAANLGQSRYRGPGDLTWQTKEALGASYEARTETPFRTSERYVVPGLDSRVLANLNADVNIGASRDRGLPGTYEFVGAPGSEPHVQLQAQRSGMGDASQNTRQNGATAAPAGNGVEAGSPANTSTTPAPANTEPPPAAGPGAAKPDANHDYDFWERPLFGHVSEFGREHLGLTDPVHAQYLEQAAAALIAAGVGLPAAIAAAQQLTRPSQPAVVVG